MAKPCQAPSLSCLAIRLSILFDTAFWLFDVSSGFEDIWELGGGLFGGILRALGGKQPDKPFRYRDPGVCGAAKIAAIWVVESFVGQLDTSKNT